jgi:hypothetical protein
MDDSSLVEICDAQKSYAISFAVGSFPVEHRLRIEEQWFRPVHTSHAEWCSGQTCKSGTQMVRAEIPFATAVLRDGAGGEPVVFDFALHNAQVSL